MNTNFKANERELVKLATFFKKESQRLIAAGKLGEESVKVEEAVDKFIDHMNRHADTRTFILDQREQLKSLVKDEAECPTCRKRDMIKVVGTEKSEQGWTSNRYRCRRCNIEFTWNRPNNPWDLIEYIEEMMALFKKKAQDLTISEPERQHILESIPNMEANLSRLKPVIEAHDKEYNEWVAREAEMEKLVHEFKNSLMIERIKLDTWENRQK
jgi:DNA-directed RNA polymerase subunit M/transcription elongation factor TFIIS